MSFVNDLERKYGRYALRNLPLYMLIIYAIGYALQYLAKVMPVNLLVYMQLDPGLILKGQVWRLISWLMIPPESTYFIFIAIMLVFYYSISNSLVNAWGAFRFNLYIIGGILFTVIGAFLMYVILLLLGMNTAGMTGLWGIFSTYYVNMSIFLAYAATYPNNQVLLMFVIPVKVKWLGIAYAAMMVFDAVVYTMNGYWPIVVVMVCSLLNFLVFFFVIQRRVRSAVRHIKSGTGAKKEPTKTMRITRHRCAICGKTESTDPDLTFRFCSKCAGNYEYCSEHLFTHTHITQE